MTRINAKLGLKPAGKSKRMTALSGVRCETCDAPDVRPVGRDGRRWFCATCGHAWTPSDAEVAAYNDRVRPRDQL